jgi:hypothetical protein
MKLRTSIAAVGAAALIGGGALAVPAFASPQATAHKLSFISVTKTQVNFSNTSVGVQETDVNKSSDSTRSTALPPRPPPAPPMSPSLTAPEVQRPYRKAG